MTSPRFTALFMALSAMLLSACSSSAWYASMHQAAVNQCEAQAPASRKDCLAKLPTQTYDSYAKERAAK